MAHPLELSLSELTSPREGFKLLLAKYEIFPDYEAGAWIILPQNPASIRLGLVVGHGYGGREQPDWLGARPDRTLIFL